LGVKEIAEIADIARNPTPARAKAARSGGPGKRPQNGSTSPLMNTDDADRQNPKLFLISAISVYQR